MLGALADLEGGSFGDIGSKLKNVSNLFLEAAGQYREISNRVGDMPIPELSPSEAELAAITWPMDRWLAFSSPPYAYDTRSTKWLYQEMTRRLEKLAVLLKSVHDGGTRDDMAPAVFQIMHDWEKLSSLARIIAVINRRGVIR